MISNIIHIELAHINTSHPDFIGGVAGPLALVQLVSEGSRDGHASGARAVRELVDRDDVGGVDSDAGRHVRSWGGVSAGAAAAAASAAGYGMPSGYHTMVCSRSRAWPMGERPARPAAATGIAGGASERACRG